MKELGDQGIKTQGIRESGLWESGIRESGLWDLRSLFPDSLISRFLIPRFPDSLISRFPLLGG